MLRFPLLRAALALVLMLFLSAAVWVARFDVPLTARWMGNAELRLIDARFLVRGPRSPAFIERVKKQVTIVAMDDSATRRYGRVLPRALHAQLVRQLKRDGAKAVIFDVLFVDPDRRDPQSDAEFARAVQDAGNVFLPFDHNSSDPTDAAIQARVEAKLALPIPARDRRDVRLQPPYAALFGAIAGGGHVATKADSDSKFRNAITLMESGAVYPHVALDAVAQTQWGVKSNDWKMDGEVLRAGDHMIGPLQRTYLENGEHSALAWMIPLDFLGGRDTMEKLTVPYLSALSGQDPSRIRDHIVIVGDYATGTPDLRPSPFDTSEVFLGVQTNATFIANLLQNDFLHPANEGSELLLTLLCGIAAGAIALRLRPSWSPVAAFGLALLVLGVSFVAFSGNSMLGALGALLPFLPGQLLLETMAPLLAIALNYSLFSAYRLTVRDRSARESEAALLETQTLLGQIVNPKLARELASSPQARLNMAIGTRRDVSILFCDIRGFTAWSETQTPEDVKTRLDEYFPTMCEICEDDFDGFIDKFIGDAIMVVWNAHKDQPDHAARATRAALSMQHALVTMNDAWRRQNAQEFQIGIGIASGDAVFGTFGAPSRKVQPTVVGDTVNLAARLESLTKEHGPVLVSCHTFESLGEEFACQFAGEVAVKGKSLAQKIYLVTSVARARGKAREFARVGE